MLMNTWEVSLVSKQSQTIPPTSNAWHGRIHFDIIDSTVGAERLSTLHFQLPGFQNLHLKTKVVHSGTQSASRYFKKTSVSINSLALKFTSQQTSIFGSFPVQYYVTFEAQLGANAKAGDDQIYYYPDDSFIPILRASPVSYLMTISLDLMTFHYLQQNMMPPTFYLNSMEGKNVTCWAQHCKQTENVLSSVLHGSQQYLVQQPQGPLLQVQQQQQEQLQSSSSSASPSYSSSLHVPSSVSSSSSAVQTKKSKRNTMKTEICVIDDDDDDGKQKEEEEKVGMCYSFNVSRCHYLLSTLYEAAHQSEELNPKFLHRLLQPTPTSSFI